MNSKNAPIPAPPTTTLTSKKQGYEWNKSCVDALAHHDRTGFHIAHDTVMAWMDSMFTEKELPAPILKK